eukprot:GHVQ01013484.1.p1 GENE.GHVQ01013484.1~~GHVQ01013484.1.p1  ORF type:complete len:622 (+),score=83.10 GHVQ01013484.1:1393-3258(+)
MATAFAMDVESPYQHLRCPLRLSTSSQCSSDSECKHMGESDHLDTLPDEVVYDVLKHLQGEDVLPLEATSKRMLNVCRQQCVWRSACETKYLQTGANVRSYAGDYRQLFQDKNGWFPRRSVLYRRGQSTSHETSHRVKLTGRSEEASYIPGEGWVVEGDDTEQWTHPVGDGMGGGVVGGNIGGDEGSLYGLWNKRKRTNGIDEMGGGRREWRTLNPKFHTTKVRLNPPLVNTMDIKQDDREILIASEGESNRHERVASVRILDAHDYSLKKIHTVNTRSINCLDASERIFACGDDNGVVRIFGRDECKLLRNFDGENPSQTGAILRSYNLPSAREINDLRMCANDIVISVKTASRYPAGVQMIDLQADKIFDIPPDRTKNNWVHAIDVDTEERSSSNVVAVGEKVSSGSFTVMKLDFRTPEIVVGEIEQTKRMLWPLRMAGSRVFVNSVFGADEKKGRVRQYDWRSPAKDIMDKGYREQEDTLQHPATLSGREGFSKAHFLPFEKVEDLRPRGDYLYVLSDKNSELSVWRFDTRYNSEPEKIATVDSFDAQEWTEPLRMLSVHDHGWSCSYGSHAKFARIAKSEDEEEHSEIHMAGRADLSMEDSPAGGQHQRRWSDKGPC